ncbi:MAG: metallophosphoesterase, partial [Terrimicrobiaceae bacterium]
MNNHRLLKLFIVLLFFPALHATCAGAAEPAGFFLTWKNDPCHSMVVDWHVEDGAPQPGLQYRQQGSGPWTSTAGEEKPYPFAKRKLFRKELSGLDADTAYEFRFGPDGRILQFQTLPEKLTRPVRFAIGGDTRHKPEWLEKTNRAALAKNPDFVVLGGDLAYENGESGNVQNVIEWFEACNKTLVTPEGRVLPVIVAIGNHEVRGGFVTGEPADSLRKSSPGMDADSFRAALAPYFYGLFACPGQPGYRVLDFGDYMSFVLLDSNHTNPIKGPQTDWLAETLSQRKNRPNVFPVYHVPAYPSVRPYEEPVSILVRETWVPLFEKYGVRLAFENHDHAYKRTKPLREGKVDGSGIVFLGDGAWGVETREPHPADTTWFLEKSAKARHFILVTLEENSRSLEVFDENGVRIDTLPASGPAAKTEPGISPQVPVSRRDQTWTVRDQTWTST